jgi:hypothetical protein
MPDDAGRGIFVSYRRSDSSYLAGRLSDRLIDRFGADEVFIDVETIEPGADFGAEIRRAMATCKVLLAVIGPRWLDATDDHGRRRLDDPDDIVRLEIEAALSRGVWVIPILMDGAVMPARYDLPGALAALADRNAVPVRHDSFRIDAGRVIGVIERVLSVPLDSGADGSPRQGTAGPDSDDAGSQSAAVVTVSDAHRSQPGTAAHSVDQAGTVHGARPASVEPASAPAGAEGASGPGTVTRTVDPQTSPVAATSLAPGSKRLRWLNKVAVVLVVAASICAFALAWRSNIGRNTDSAKPTPGSVSTVERVIPATQVWTDMNIRCASGDKLQLAVSGTVMHEDSARGEVGPNGLTDPRYHRWNVTGLPDANTVAVIGSLDQALPLFVVGSGTTYTCPRDGSLFLGVNDVGVQNNSGQFTAKITHTHAN